MRSHQQLYSTAILATCPRGKATRPTTILENAQAVSTSRIEFRICAGGSHCTSIRSRATIRRRSRLQGAPRSIPGCICLAFPALTNWICISKVGIRTHRLRGARAENSIIGNFFTTTTCTQTKTTSSEVGLDEKAWLIKPGARTDSARKIVCSSDTDARRLTGTSCPEV